jgi:hypothetical protein
MRARFQKCNHREKGQPVSAGKIIPMPIKLFPKNPMMESLTSEPKMRSPGSSEEHESKGAEELRHHRS